MADPRRIVDGVRLVTVHCEERRERPGFWLFSCQLVPQTLVDGQYVDIDDDALVAMRSPLMGDYRWQGEITEEAELGVGEQGEAPNADLVGARGLQWAKGQQEAAAARYVGRGPTLFMARERADDDAS